MIALLSELTLRHLGDSRVRLAACVVAAAFFAVVVAWGRAAAMDLTQAFEGFVAHLAGGGELSVASPGIGTPAERVDQVREVPGVLRATPVIQMPVQATESGEALLLVGVERSPEGTGWPFVPPGESGEAKEVFVAQGFAARHGLAAGSPVRLSSAAGPVDFVVRGFLPDTPGVAVYGGQVAVAAIGTLQAAFARTTLVDRIDVALAPGADENAVVAALRELCGPGTTVTPPAVPGARLRFLVAPLRTALSLSAFLVVVALATGAFAIAGALARPREDVSVSSARGYSSVEPPPVRALRLATLGAGLSVAAWLPALRGSAVAGAIAVVSAVAGAACLTPAFVVTLCRIAARAVTAGGVTPRFGADYVARTLGRSTAATLAVALLLGTSLASVGWLASLERSLSAWTAALGAGDLTVTRGSPLLDDPHLVFAGSAAPAVAALPGVESVQRRRVFEQRVDANTLRIVATDTALQGGAGWPLLRGAPLTRHELERGPEIVLSEGAAAALGKDVGDLVTVHAPKGDVAFVVRAIAADYTAAELTGVIDRRHLTAHWGDETIDALSVRLAAGRSPEAVAAEVRSALGSDGPVFVTQTSALRAELAGTIAAVFEPARALGRIVSVAAALCAAAVLAATGEGRRAQIRRRFAGAPRRELTAAIFVEAGIRGASMAAAGVFLGVILAQLTARAILVDGARWHVGMAVPWGSAGALAIIVAATSMLCAIPASRTARALTSP